MPKRQRPKRRVSRKTKLKNAVSVDRTRDLQIFSLTLSQLSYPRNVITAVSITYVTVKSSSVDEVDAFSAGELCVGKQIQTMASIPQIILCNFSIHDGFNKEPRNRIHAKGRSLGSSLLQNKLGLRTCLIEHRQRWRLMGRGEIGILSSEKKALERRRRVVTVRCNKGLGFNGGDNNGNGRILGNLALAIGLTYLSMTGQLGWILDAIVSVWLIVVIVPILGLGAFLWWAQRDIVQSNCPNCGNEFQIFKSAMDDEVQLCPFCTQPFSVVDDKFVKEPVKFSSQTTAFGQDLNGFSSKPKKGKGFSTAVVDIEAEVTDVD